MQSIVCKIPVVFSNFDNICMGLWDPRDPVFPPPTHLESSTVAAETQVASLFRVPAPPLPTLIDIHESTSAQWGLPTQQIVGGLEKGVEGFEPKSTRGFFVTILPHLGDKEPKKGPELKS